MGAALLGGWLAAGISPRDIAVVEPHPSDALRSLAAENRFRAQSSAQSRAKCRAGDQAADAGPGRAEPRALARCRQPADLDSRRQDHRQSRRAPAGAQQSCAPCPTRRRRSGAESPAPSPIPLSRRRNAIWRKNCCRASARSNGSARNRRSTPSPRISGSGPAYVFLLVEALAQGGEALGLPPDLAMRLARATVEGSGELLHRAPEISAETLRKNVTSPGGTTQAALDVLMAQDGLAALMARATAAAAKRAGELGRLTSARCAPAFAPFSRSDESSD